MRQAFGLTQAELARFLGVSREMVSRVEAGSKEFGEQPRQRLWALAHWLPAPDGQGPPVPTFGTGPDLSDPHPAAAPDLPGPLDPAPLRARLRRCRFLAAKARYELDITQGEAQRQARRRWAVEVLRARLGPAAPPLPAPWDMLLATPDPAADHRWLDRLARDTAAEPPALTVTSRALLLLRLASLEREAAALETLLAG